MGAKRKEFSTEQAAVEQGAAADRVTDQGASTREVKYDSVPQGYGVLTAHETPALAWGLDAVSGDPRPALLERDLDSLRHLMKKFGEQRREIRLLRENTRVVLASLSPA